MLEVLLESSSQVANRLVTLWVSLRCADELSLETSWVSGAEF